MGRDRLFDLLREKDMLVIRKRSYTKTTNSHHWLRRYPNLVKDFTPTAPEQLWVADITYLRTCTEFQYLHLITDAYSKKIMGYELSEDLSAASTCRALQMARAARNYPGRALIHHSDRGIQYCSNEYTGILLSSGISISMTENSDPYENAVAERINGILKDEFGLDATFEYETQLRTQVEQTIRIYNEHRPHMSNRMLTPTQMHRQEKRSIIKWNKNQQSHEQVPAHETVYLQPKSVN